MVRPRTAGAGHKQVIRGAHRSAPINNVHRFVGDGAEPRTRWTKQSAMENYIGAALMKAASAMQAR